MASRCFDFALSGDGWSSIASNAGTLVSHSEINVDEGIVTAPEHGSQFSTRTEERGRGPSDEGLRTFQVVVEDGQVWVELDQA